MATGAKQAMSDQEADKVRAEPSVEVTQSRDAIVAGGVAGISQGIWKLRSIWTSCANLSSLIIENGVMDFELEREGFRVKVDRNTYRERASESEAAATSEAEKQVGASSSNIDSSVPLGLRVPPRPPPHPGAHAEEAASEDQDLHIITSPIVGTFYRSPSPTAESFVRIGSQVEPDTVVCIIEAMKLMNEIQAETTGEVVKIYVENGQAVEYGQPLFGIKSMTRPFSPISNCRQGGSWLAPIGNRQLHVCL